MGFRDELVAAALAALTACTSTTVPAGPPAAAISPAATADSAGGAAAVPTSVQASRPPAAATEPGAGRTTPAAAAGSPASPATTGDRRKDCNLGQWRDPAAAGSCVSDPDSGPGTCGDRMIHVKGSSCDCAVNDLSCHVQCGLIARWTTPAPPEERADCRAKCDHGRPWACYKLALADLRAGTQRHPRAIGRLDRACSLEVDHACEVLLRRTLAGDALAGAAPSLLPWMEQQCATFEHEHRACAGLATVLEQGWGVVVDRPRARSLYERACSRESSQCVTEPCRLAADSCKAARRLGGGDD